MHIQININELIYYVTLYYPFTFDELKRYKNNINFKILSENENIKWDYYIINEFEDIWEWYYIERNLSINSRVTLGLLFPERFDLVNCDCPNPKDFCDCYRQQPRNLKYERSLLSDSNKEEFSMFFAIDFMIQSEIVPEDLEGIFIDKIFPMKFMIKEILDDI